MKLGFNVGRVAIQPTVAILVFRAIVGGSPPHDPRVARGLRRRARRRPPAREYLVALAVWLNSVRFRRDIVTWSLLTDAGSVFAKTAMALLAVVAIDSGGMGARAACHRCGRHVPSVPCVRDLISATSAYRSCTSSRSGLRGRCSR